MNRATADNQSAQSEEEGLEPTKEWVKDLIDEIIAEEFASPDLELHWLDEDADPAATEAALEGRVKLGAVTLNEMRDALGLDPFQNAAADRPMVLTLTGYVPIEAGASPPSSPAGRAPRGASAARTPLTRGLMRPHGSTDLPVEPGNDPSLHKYSPDQPSVPAGNPDGGQWTSEDETGSSGNSSDFVDDKSHVANDMGTQYGALDTGTRTDATEAATGNETGVLPGNGYAALPDFRRFDLTGNDYIDLTSLKLSIIFEAVIEANPPASGMTPQQYGTFIHLEFADAVRAAQLPGISSVDVETTFPEGQQYGSPDSIRTDVVLRYTDGTIAAIFDIKTGASELSPARADQLRAKTQTPPDTPVVEIRMQGILLKIQTSP
jgi:hypothetical protein